MSDENGPTPPSERIVSLDVLRGVALLGILVINVRVFAMPEVVLLNPTAFGDFSGANYATWFLGHVFVEQKFITLFSMLFGAGVVLFTRGAGEDLTMYARYLRRIAFLLLVGFAHAYLLWYGDILVAYALCGLAVLGLRTSSPRMLVGIAAVLLAIPAALELGAALADPAAVAGQWRPTGAALQAEIEAYRGGWLAQMSQRFPTAVGRQTSGFLGYTAWRTSGCMLLGMALFKWGVLTNDRSTRFYRRLAVGGGALGLGLVLAGVWYIEASGWAADAALFWRQFNYWGSLPLATAYVGVVMLFCRRYAGPLRDGLAAVGRTAFSNYILQTLLATTIFYGHGLGLFARVSRVEAFGVVVLIWAIQVPLSVWWLRRYRFGPLEWLWRTVTYGERQPLRLDRE